MSVNAGQLLVVRKNMLLAGGATTVDTGLRAENRGYGNDSNGEPGDNGSNPVLAVPGVPSRVQVVPMAPTSAWANITHGEPYVAPNANGDPTVHVDFANAGGPATINAMFWNPHSLIGPCQCDTYIAPSPPIG